MKQLSFKKNGIACVLIALAGCGGGSSTSSTATATQSGSSSLPSSVLNDAPVKGVCYSASPSGLAGATSSTGSYQYDAGDTVTFWIDGSGAGCASSTATSASSILLGSYVPSGGQTFVLALATGEQVAETLTALNHGSAASMDVSGIQIASAQVSAVNSYISSTGATLPSSAGGSVDQMFSAVQTATAAAPGAGSSLTFVAPLTSATSSSSILQTTVANNLVATVATGLGGAPTSITIPAGAIRFAVSTSTYTNPLSASPTVSHVNTRARFNYYDGNGNGVSFMSPNNIQIAAGQGVTAATLSTLTETYTYSVPASGNTFTKTVSGIDSNGNTFTQPDTSVTITYQDSASNDSEGSYSDAYTSGPQTGSVFQVGTFTSSGLDLTPLTLAMLAGHTLTMSNHCGDNNNSPLMLAFSSDGTSVTQTCGTEVGTGTVSTTAIPGVLLFTGGSGTLIYIGLMGSGLVTGASVVFIEESAGNAGWGVHQILSVQ